MNAASVVSPTTPSTDLAVIQSRYAAALARAAAANMVAYREFDGVYSVPSASEAGVEHTVCKIGPKWYQWSCTCAGSNHVACTHRALALFAHKYGVSAKRPTPDVVEQAETIAAAIATLDVQMGTVALTTSCRDCGKESAAGFALCASCAASRNRRWDAQDGSYNLPLHRI